MRRLYFIRHAESEFNKSHKWVGSSTDAPLTKAGHDQAQEAGEALKKEAINFDLIISSPLIRAHKTAEYVAEALGYPPSKILVNKQLVERNFGTLEGKKHLVAATKYLMDESAIDKYEEVEKLLDLQARVDNFLDYLHTLEEENIVVVGHGAFGRALRRAVNKEPVSKRGKSFKNAELERLI